VYMHTHQAALLPRRVCVCVRERGYYNMRNGNNQHTLSAEHLITQPAALMQYRRAAAAGDALLFLRRPAAFLFCLSQCVCVLIIASESSSFNFNNASFRP
jgi:hypothetical protein